MWHRRRRGFYFFSVATVLALAVAGCATQPKPHGVGLPGFFLGLLHGFLILFNLICSLFMDVRIYDFPNAGRWYDFGYFLGAAIFLGGSGSRA